MSRKLSRLTSMISTSDRQLEQSFKVAGSVGSSKPATKDQNTFL